MKSLLLSDRPKWVAKILNGEKTIEIRKTAPKCELSIDVYIYCTKTIKPISDYDWGEFTFNDLPKLGKVVAKFTLREVEKIIALSKEEKPIPYYATGMDLGDTLRKATLSEESLREYLKDKDGYAWHISDLEIFDKPKALSDFGLKRAPQSWCYIEPRGKIQKNT